MADGEKPEIEVYIPLEERGRTEAPLGAGPLDSLDVNETDLNNGLSEADHDSPDDPNALLDNSLWKKRSRVWTSSKVHLTSSKEISRYIKQHAGNPDKALLNVIQETDSAKFPEGRITLYVSELIQKGARVSATDEEQSNTALHLAARRGFSEVAKELLRSGADPHTQNKEGKTPLEIAVYYALDISVQEDVDDYNSFAVLMIKRMDPAKVRSLFLSEVGGTPALNFHALLENEDMRDTVNAVMDTLIERLSGRKRTYNVYYDLLESNRDGKIVRNPNKISLRRRLGKSAFDKIAWNGNKDAASHLVVRLMIHSKWKRFARNFLIVHFLYWALTMVAISAALIIAAEELDPENYDHPLDNFRAFFEASAVLLVGAATLTEFYHIYLWRQYYFLDYSFFVYNYLNLTTMLFIIVLIPLRALAFDEQWIFAAFAYVSYSLRVLRYVNSIAILGKYIQILYLIVRRDLIPFISITIILNYIFSGGFYFALREEVISPTLTSSVCDFSSVQQALSVFNLTPAEVQAAVNTSFATSLDINPFETSTYPRVFFTGIRIAVEGQSFLTYFGANGFGWLGVITYLVFLFFLEVVLLNLLIAQMSDTFSNVQGDAQRSLAINQARTIISIERTGLSILKCLTDFYKSEEQWSNPRKHVERLDQTSITNIHRIALKTQRVVNQHTNTLEDLRDTVAEQNLSTNEKLEVIMRVLGELSRKGDHTDI